MASKSLDEAADATGLVARVPYLALLRPGQWIKNAFVAAPLFFTPEAVSGAAAGRVGLGIVAFSLAASAVYIVNDLRDREADRHHAEKRFRPLAAGTVSPGLAAALAFALAAAALALAAALGVDVLVVVLAYLTLQVAYCFALKRIAIVDVLAIAVGFVLRIFAGAAVIAVTPSAWIVVCAGLLALFLALGKRRDDLVRELDGDHRGSLAGYTLDYVDRALTVTVAALLIAYLVYTTDAGVTARLGTDKLYLTALFVVAGVLRYLQIVIVEKRSGAPTQLVYRDRFLQGAVLGWLVTFAALIYG